MQQAGVKHRHSSGAIQQAVETQEAAKHWRTIGQCDISIAITQDGFQVILGTVDPSSPILQPCACQTAGKSK
jgi:hypothetical protein